MRKKYRIPFLVILVMCWTMLCGMGLGIDFEWNEPILDTRTTPIYDKFDNASLQRAAASNYKDTEQKYKGRQVVISGSAASVSKDRKAFWLMSGNGGIYVKNKNGMPDIKDGDSVWAYGHLMFGDEKGGSITLIADHVDKSSAKLSADYYVRGGKSYTKTSADEQSLANGMIRFSVPSNWSLVEITGEEKEKLFNVDGAEAKGYMLNALRDKDEVEACCVFYFNNKANIKTDSVARDTFKVEKEIVSNICKGNYHVLAQYTDITSYKTQYDRYVGEYGSYRVEFAFTKAKGGLCVIMYIYRGDSTAAADDMRFLQRTLIVEN